MSSEIKSQENYLDIITQILHSNCTKIPNELPPQNPTGLIDLSQSMFKNNLQAKNWIFGNITEEQYRLQVFANSIKYNLTSCPIDKPYVSSVTSKCFDCPSDAKFSLGANTCICPTELIYDANENECTKNCSKNEVFNKEKKICEKKVVPPPPATKSFCPQEKPSWNNVNKVCEPCPLELPYYSTRTKKCIKCPKSTAWSSIDKKCVKNCTNGTILNTTTQLC